VMREVWSHRLAARVETSGAREAPKEPDNAPRYPEH
jgi:hypothetical protein